MIAAITTREDLIKQYYALAHILRLPEDSRCRPVGANNAAMEEERQAILKMLMDPEYREQPRDRWQTVHGLWLTVAMENDGYLPGTLLRVRTGTSFFDGKEVCRAVLASKMNGTGREIVLPIDPQNPDRFLGAEQVTPGPIYL